MGKDNLTSAGMAMTEEQQSMPLRDAVFMSLRKAILTGKLKPGDRLTEVKLGKLLGTSRTPIREAIRLLEEDGLVTIVAGSGARVSRMTVEDLQEVMEIRSALEQLSAGLASERITEEEKEQLQRITSTASRHLHDKQNHRKRLAQVSEHRNERVDDEREHKPIVLSV